MNNVSSSNPLGLPGLDELQTSEQGLLSYWPVAEALGRGAQHAAEQPEIDDFVSGAVRFKQQYGEACAFLIQNCAIKKEHLASSERGKKLPESTHLGLAMQDVLSAELAEAETSLLGQIINGNTELRTGLGQAILYFSAPLDDASDLEADDFFKRVTGLIQMHTLFPTRKAPLPERIAHTIQLCIDLPAAVVLHSQSKDIASVHSALGGAAMIKVKNGFYDHVLPKILEDGVSFYQQMEWGIHVDPPDIAKQLKRLGKNEDSTAQTRMEDFVVGAVDKMLIFELAVSSCVRLKGLKPHLKLWFDHHLAAGRLSNPDSPIWDRLTQLFGETPFPAYLQKHLEQLRNPENPERSSGFKKTTSSREDGRRKKPTPDAPTRRTVAVFIQPEVTLNAQDLVAGNFSFTAPNLAPDEKLWACVKRRSNGGDYKVGDGGLAWQALVVDQNGQTSLSGEFKPVDGKSYQVLLTAGSTPPSKGLDPAHIKTVQFSVPKAPSQDPTPPAVNTATTGAKSQPDGPFDNNPQATAKAQYLQQQEPLAEALLEAAVDWPIAVDNFDLTETDLTLNFTDQAQLYWHGSSIEHMALTLDPLKLTTPLIEPLSSDLKAMLEELVTWAEATTQAAQSEAEQQAAAKAAAELTEVQEQLEVQLRPLQNLGARYQPDQFRLPGNKGFVWDKILQPRSTPFIQPHSALTLDYKSIPIYGMASFRVDHDWFRVTFQFDDKKNQRTSLPTVSITTQPECPFSQTQLDRLAWGCLYNLAFQLDENALKNIDPEEYDRQAFWDSAEGKAQIETLQERLAAGKEVRVMRENQEGYYERRWAPPEEIDFDDKMVLVGPKITTRNKGYENLNKAMAQPYFKYGIYLRIRATVKAEHGLNGESRKPFVGAHFDLVFEILRDLGINQTDILNDSSQTYEAMQSHVPSASNLDLVEHFIAVLQQRNLPAVFFPPRTVTLAELERINSVKGD